MRSISLFGLILALVLWADVAVAGERFSGGFNGLAQAPSAAPPGLTRGAGNVADPGTAARQAASMTGGRVLDVQTDFADGRPRYMVKILTGDGRVKVVPIDGATTRGFAD